MKDTKKIPETNSLAPFFNASILEICLWIICYTSETDVEMLNKQDRYTLIEYCSYVQKMQGFELVPMPFAQWYNSDQDDLKVYQTEQENLSQEEVRKIYDYQSLSKNKKP